MSMVFTANHKFPKNPAKRRDEIPYNNIAKKWTAVKNTNIKTAKE